LPKKTKVIFLPIFWQN